MIDAKKIINSSYFFWALLAIPSLPILLTLLDCGGQRGLPHTIVHDSGIIAVWLLLITMSLSPLQTIFPKSRIMEWLMQRRRHIGVAVFPYSVIHLAFYLVDLGSIREVLPEFAAPGILAGLLAFFILIPMTITSNAVMTRAMGWRRWKMLQRGIYAVAILVLAHWLIIEQEPAPLVLFGALGALELWRLWRTWASDKSINNRIEQAKT